MTDCEDIVVLGFRNEGERAKAINCHRMCAALRSVNPSADRSVLVFSGGTVRESTPDAVLMEGFVRAERG